MAAGDPEAGAVRHQPHPCQHLAAEALGQRQAFPTARRPRRRRDRCLQLARGQPFQNLLDQGQRLAHLLDAQTDTERVLRKAEYVKLLFNLNGSVREDDPAEGADDPGRSAPERDPADIRTTDANE